MKNYIKAALTAILTAQCTAVMIQEACPEEGPSDGTGPFDYLTKENGWNCEKTSADFNPKIKGLQECRNLYLEEVPSGGCRAEWEGLSEIDGKCYSV